MKRIFITLLFFGTGLQASQPSPRKRSKSFVENVLHDESPANLLLFWSHGLNHDNYNRDRHILEHVYSDTSYKESDFASRQQAMKLCVSGMCGVLPDNKFKVYGHHLARKNFDRIFSVVQHTGNDDVWCDLCTPNDGSGE